MQRLLVASLAVLASSLGAPAVAQCDQWQSGFGYPGLSDAVRAMLVHDDGSGSELFVASGSAYAGETTIRGVGKWNGSRWAALGSGGVSDGTAYSLTIFDDGTGPALYAGGSFSHLDGVAAARVAKWDGANWNPLGAGVQSSVYALQVFDDGSGDALYAAGSIYSAGGAAAQQVARWDGANWSAVGAGLEGGYVYDLEVYDDGSGAKLYAVGEFTTSSGAPLAYLAVWDGSSWSSVGGGVDGISWELAVFDDGTGAALYVGGLFTHAGGTPADKIARWDGSTWSQPGAGLAKSPTELHVFDDGSGAALYAGFLFTNDGSTVTSQVLRLQGGAWSAIPGGPMSHSVYALESYDDGSGEKLIVGGDFLSAGGSASPVIAMHIAELRGASWAALGGNGAPYRTLNALVIHDDGSGPRLYAGGEAWHLGSSVANGIGSFDGQGWQALGTGMGGIAPYAPIVNALASADLGSGPALYAAGAFKTAGGVNVERIAKWDGSAWSALGAGLNGEARAVCAYDDGGGVDLYVGGDFVTAGGVTVNRIARWDGANWSALAGGVSGFPEVRALAVFDDGNGAQLYVGGAFDQAGTTAVSNLARWNGTSWDAVGGGVSDLGVEALTVWDDGQGPALYVGGTFFTVGNNQPIYNVARWKNSSWSALAGSSNFYEVRSLVGARGATGNYLYVGGTIASMGGQDHGLLRWNGSAWSSVEFEYQFSDPDPTPEVLALALYDSGAGPQLYAGGYFVETATQRSYSIAARKLCAPPGDVFCPSGSQACPCGGTNAPGAGCPNSIGLGAQLANTGAGTSAHFDNVVLSATQMPPNRTVVFVGSPSPAVAAAPFHAGLMCLGPPRLRLAISTSDAQGSSSLAGINSATLGAIAAGDVWKFQTVYRDSPLTGCARTVNITSGIELVFTP